MTSIGDIPYKVVRLNIRCAIEAIVVFAFRGLIYQYENNCGDNKERKNLREKGDRECVCERERKRE